MDGPPESPELLTDEVRRILLRDWDPIGISVEPEAQGEYDDYVAEICSMLLRSAPRQRLINHLCRIETDLMGLRGDRQRAENAAERLIELRDSLHNRKP